MAGFRGSRDGASGAPLFWCRLTHNRYGRVLSSRGAISHHQTAMTVACLFRRSGWYALSFGASHLTLAVVYFTLVRGLRITFGLPGYSGIRRLMMMLLLSGTYCKAI